MKFDREKVLTAFNATKGREGDIGWFANTPKELKIIVGDFKKAKELIQCDGMITMPFVAEDGKVSMFFYPAPYEYLQKKWVEENNLKVGDKVKVVRLWEVGERGFRETVGDIKVGHIRTVEGFSDGCIQVRKGSLIARYPYFAIEKVKDEYRPFKDAEEFAPYREKWWIDKETGDNVRFVLYCEDGLLNTFRGLATWKDLFEEYLDEEGNPAGVKV